MTKFINNTFSKPNEFLLAVETELNKRAVTKLELTENIVSRVSKFKNIEAFSQKNINDFVDLIEKEFNGVYTITGLDIKDENGEALYGVYVRGESL